MRAVGTPTPAVPRLRLSGRFRRTAEVDGRVVLLGEEEWAVAPEGPVARVLPLVDGRRTEEDLVAALREEVRPEVVHYAVMVFRSAGWLEEEGDAVARGRNGHRRADTRGPGPPPPWEGDPAIGGARLRGRLLWPGASEPPDVLAVRNPLDPRLAGLGKWARSGDGPLLLVRPLEEGAWVGPLLEADGGVCWSCARRRMRANLPHLQLLADREDGGPGAGGWPRASMDGVRGFLEALGGPAGLSAPGTTILELRPQGGALGPVRTHRLIPCPDCRRCRGVDPLPSRQEPCAGPTAAWERLSIHVSPVAGQVRSLERVPVEGVRDAHVYTAGHVRRPAAPPLRALLDLRRDPSGGSAATDREARLSALCEALERRSGTFRGDEPTVSGSLDSLGEDALDPRSCLTVSERQYSRRREINACTSSPFNRVPEPFDPGATMPWTVVRRLPDGARRLLPTAYLHLGFVGPGSSSCPGDSNGLAAGTSVEDAAVRGFLELVERDAVACWWYNRTRHPAVDLASFRDPVLDRTVADYRGIGREVWALDLTTDLGVPCFAALSRVGDGGPEAITFGFGAHLDPRRALRGAVDEMNQMLPAVQAPPAARRRQLGAEFRDALDWWATASLRADPYLAPAPGPARSADSRASLATGRAAEDLDTCVAVARRASLEVFVLDLTRADIGLPVVRVVVPGLRHFWRRLGPGRLYEVPVALGLLDEPTQEERLNPRSVFV